MTTAVHVVLPNAQALSPHATEHTPSPVAAKAIGASITSPEVRVGASSPIRCVVSHRLQSAVSGHSVWGYDPTCDPLVFSPGDGVSVDTVYGAARSGAKRCW